MRVNTITGGAHGIRPCLVRAGGAAGCEHVGLGHPLLDAFLEMVAARARWNTVLATVFDLKVFFSVIAIEPAAVTTADVLAFIASQRAPRRGATVVRIKDGEPALSARTIKRRLATIAGPYEYLIIRGDAGVMRNPVPRGLAMRRPGQRCTRGVPLIRGPRTLPRVINPAEVDAVMGALRTQRDRVMVQAMLLGGLRRSEVLGLRLTDLRPGEHRIFVAEGKGGHERIVPRATRFFVTIAAYLNKAWKARGRQGRLDSPQAGRSAWAVWRYRAPGVLRQRASPEAIRLGLHPRSFADSMRP